MPDKTIKIFIASSSELKADRDEFRIFIGVENDRLHKQGIYLEIIQWEYFLDAISDTRQQNEYNKAIRECDIVLCLFFTKVGKYTAEEFDTAYEVFKNTGKPKIWTYFKDAPVNTGSIEEEILSLISFKKKITELGQFYAVYTNIDNLKYKFRGQLDNFLPSLTRYNEGSFQGTAENKISINQYEQVKNSFNEILTRRLIISIGIYSPLAQSFLKSAQENAKDWEKNTIASDRAKLIIASAFVGVLGIQLRKLIAIGKEDLSDQKLRKYFENCQLTAKRSLQLLCFSLMAKLWDYKNDTNYILSPGQTAVCKNFFDNEFELNIDGLINLLKTLMDVFTSNNLEFPIPELNQFKPNLNAESAFIAACSKLQDIDSLAGNPACTINDCTEAESQLCTVLETLNFLAGYRMESIKSIGCIGYFEMRNSKPHYLHSYTALGTDIKSNINQEKIKYADAPINTDAVLLYKESIGQHLNLFPFIIDANAIAFEGGAKICFYTSYNNADDSLNYNFLEDNSIVNIINTETRKSGTDLNKLLLDPKKHKDMRFDAVVIHFKEAKKAITE